MGNGPDYRRWGIFAAFDGRWFIKGVVSDQLPCIGCQHQGEGKCEEVTNDQGGVTGVRVPRDWELPCIRQILG